MKKFLAILLLFPMLCFAQSAEEKRHEKWYIANPPQDIDHYWDGVMRWIAVNEDTYGLRIAYKNMKTGALIVKGEYKDSSNDMMCVEKGFVRPYASFTIELKYSNKNVVVEMTEATYEYKASYVSSYSLNSLSTSTLKWCRQEMEEIKHMMKTKGEILNCYDSYFGKRHKELSESISAARKIEYDENSSKKERKQAKKYLEENGHRDYPYWYVYFANTHTFYELMNEGSMSLTKFVRSQK